LSSDGLEHSSRQIFYDRVHWALYYLRNARLIEGTRRGFYKRTKRGVDVLNHDPEVINVKYLKQFPEFNDFLTRSSEDKETDSISEKEHPEAIIDKTPEEVMEDGYQLIRENLVREMLENVKRFSPNFFERLVVQLLVAMGSITNYLGFFDLNIISFHNLDISFVWFV
jgi:restriction system protein